MSMTILFAAGEGDFATYEPLLRAGLDQAGIAADLVLDAAPDTVDLIIYAPASPLQDFTPFTRCQAVLSLWAGVERIAGNPTLTQPLARLVDPDLTQGMIEYVTGHVLRYQVGMDAQVSTHPGDWVPTPPPLARDRVVGVLGLGALGQASAKALVALGFQVLGWSRQAKTLPDIRCHTGEDGLRQVLGTAEILVTLLPHTSATENLLDATRLQQCRRGLRLINPGRGALIEDTALLAALDRGQIAHATLDVFRTEPLPAAHPFWAHPKITITPHIAAATRPASAARSIVANIARLLRGDGLLHQVSRSAGY